MLDTVIIGAGPSGLALAAELGARGVRTGVVDGRLSDVWKPNYGAWSDRLPAGLADEITASSWGRPIVETGRGRQVIDRTYVRVDKVALQRTLTKSCSKAGVLFVQAYVSHVEHCESHSIVSLDDGTRLEAKRIVDASGHAGRFVKRPSERASAHQLAWGELIEVARHPWQPGEMVFMDWRPFDGKPWGERKPTFLYAMPLDEHRVFVEETALATASSIGFDELSRRLALRLETLGVTPRRRLDEERCTIPMDMPLPETPQRVIGFGGAASMVHVVSGYMLSRVLSMAGPLADCLVTHLEDGAAEASSAAWELLQPATGQRQRAASLLGLKTILGMNGRQTQDFFHSFFAMKPRRQAAWLESDVPLLDTFQAMAAMFSVAPGPVRHTLLRSALGPARPEFLRAFAPGPWRTA